MGRRDGSTVKCVTFLFSGRVISPTSTTSTMNEYSDQSSDRLIHPHEITKVVRYLVLQDVLVLARKRARSSPPYLLSLEMQKAWQNAERQAEAESG